MEKTLVNKSIIGFISKLTKNLLVEKMSDIELDKLVRFNKDVYKDEFNAARFVHQEEILKLWKWKYNTNPASEDTKNFGWLASYKGDLIAQINIMPVDLKIGNNDYKGVWGTDLAVVAKYRNIGISVFLMQHARKEVEKDFAMFLVGGMNANSYNVVKNSGFIDLGEIPRYVRIIDFDNFLDCYGIPKFFSILANKCFFVIDKLLCSNVRIKKYLWKIEVTKTFNDEFEEFWKTVSVDYKCTINRNLDFLKWRYLEQPLHSYSAIKVLKNNKITAFAVLREGKIKNGKLKDKRIGLISDILCDTKDVESLNKLIKTVVEFFKEKKVLIIRCDILDSKIKKFLYKNFFVKIKSESRFVVSIRKKNIPQADIDLAAKKTNWHITSADSDFDFD